MRINKDKLSMVLARNSMNINDAAKACGVNRSMFYKYRSREIKPITVSKIANALGCTIDELV